MSADLERGDRPVFPERGSGPGEGTQKSIDVEVNGRDVVMIKEVVTGFEIKEAAIAQGVNIQATFVLQQELPNGSSKIVGDRDEVHLRKHLRFTAIAPDDNS